MLSMKLVHRGVHMRTCGRGMDAVVLLVARFVHSLPKVFAVSGTPRDVERIVASLRDVVVARKLERPLRVHLLRALQLLCKLQTGIISLQQLETAVAATDLAICEHHLLWSLDDLYMVLEKICQTNSVSHDDIETMVAVNKNVDSPPEESESEDSNLPCTPSCSSPDSVFDHNESSMISSTVARRLSYSRGELLSFRTSKCSLSEPETLPEFIRYSKSSSTNSKQSPIIHEKQFGQTKRYRTRSIRNSESRANIVDKWEHDMYDPNQ